MDPGFSASPNCNNSRDAAKKQLNSGIIKRLANTESNKLQTFSSFNNEPPAQDQDVEPENQPHGSCRENSACRHNIHNNMIQCESLFAAPEGFGSQI
jgi:hypothetical protein